MRIDGLLNYGGRRTKVPQNKIELNIPEVAAQEKALRCAAEILGETGTKYQKTMDEMAGAWQGSSGTSFAGAAKRVEAGYTIIKSVLEQMIIDVAATQKSMTDQDTLTAQSVTAMTIE